MIELQDTVVHKPKLISSGMDEDLALLNIQTGKYYGLNAVGRRIFEKIEQAILVKKLCEDLVLEFEVSLEKCQSEVLAFLNHLDEQGLLVKLMDVSCSQDACSSASLSV